MSTKDRQKSKPIDLFKFLLIFVPIACIFDFGLVTMMIIVSIVTLTGLIDHVENDDD